MSKLRVGVKTFWPLTVPLMLLPLTLMTTGAPPLVRALQARLAGIERNVDQRVTAGGDIEIAAGGSGPRSVAVPTRVRGNRVHLGQGAAGDMEY